MSRGDDGGGGAVDLAGGEPVEVVARDDEIHDTDGGVVGDVDLADDSGGVDVHLRDGVLQRAGEPRGARHGRVLDPAGGGDEGVVGAAGARERGGAVGRDVVDDAAEGGGGDKDLGVVGRVVDAAVEQGLFGVVRLDAGRADVAPLNRVDGQPAEDALAVALDGGVQLGQVVGEPQVAVAQVVVAFHAVLDTPPCRRRRDPARQTRRS
ncbi:hypothetical protein MRB53_042281 [Persea americana]|nr:hypothetical protein MRB53_042281 [Persea americana]